MTCTMLLPSLLSPKVFALSSEKWLVCYRNPLSIMNPKDIFRFCSSEPLPMPYRVWTMSVLPPLKRVPFSLSIQALRQSRSSHNPREPKPRPNWTHSKISSRTIEYLLLSDTQTLYFYLENHAIWNRTCESLFSGDQNTFTHY